MKIKLWTFALVAVLIGGCYNFLAQKRWCLFLFIYLFYLFILFMTGTFTNKLSDYRFNMENTLDKALSNPRPEEGSNCSDESGEDGSSVDLRAAERTLDEMSGEEGDGNDYSMEDGYTATGSTIKPLLCETELGEVEACSSRGPWAGRFQLPGTGQYEEIREANIKRYEVATIYGSKPSCGFNESFRNLGDNRHTLAKDINNTKKKLNISHSFDPQKFLCIGCAKPHPVGRLGEQKAPFFILSDQCLPPLAPPMGQGGCLTFTRVEDGTLAEICDVFEEAISGKWLPKGTGLAISAGGHLARVGTAAYAADLVVAVNRLKKLLPPASFVAHGPMAFACGLSDPGLIRSVSDICTWQCVMAKEGVVGDFLPISNKATVRLIERWGTVGVQTPFPLRFQLPINMATGQLKNWLSDSPDGLPLATLNTEEGDEAELLYYLCTEVNRLLGSNLDTQVCTTRDVKEGGASSPENLIFVGNKHGERLAKAAAAMGKDASYIPLPNISEVEIRCCARSVREKIAEIPPGCRQNSLVVFSILDDKLYMARSSEGGQTPCRSDKKGVTHVEGKLILALESGWLKEVLSSYQPLLEACVGV